MNTEINIPVYLSQDAIKLLHKIQAQKTQGEIENMDDVVIKIANFWIKEHTKSV